jgi:CBS domain-containing protein
MIANSTAYVVSRRFESQSLYDALLEQDGIRLLHGPQATHQLERLCVRQAMTTQVEVLGPELTVGEAIPEMERRGFTVYPVLDAEGDCLGLVNLARVRRVMAEGGQATRLRELVRLAEYVCPDDALIRAVVRMNTLETRHLPVIEKSTRLFCGLLTMSDIFRAQALAADGAEQMPASEKEV